jgi:hypothetical protein
LPVCPIKIGITRIYRLEYLIKPCSCVVFHRSISFE